MRSVVVGTAGHIDHGKSALVLALTGSDPDRLKEEKARGITIDLGFANWTSGDCTFAFVDVPGHERFVRNMLAGVGGIDLVVLVVAADESVMPQTREHFEICRLLEVPVGLVAVTKTDLVDSETLELVRLEVRDLVAGSFLEGAPVVAVSSKTGTGFDQLRDALVVLGTRLPGRPIDGPARLPVDRVFSMKGFGTVVTGTLVSGRLEADQDLVLLPSGRGVKVRGLQVHGRRTAVALAGQRVAANLGGLEVVDVRRGETLTGPGLLEATRRLDTVIEVVKGAAPLAHGSRVRFHQGTVEALGRVAVVGPTEHAGPLVATGEHDAGGPTPTRAVEVVPPGRRAYARIRLESAVVVTRGDRFILRAYSPPRTIGGGTVLDPLPPRTGVRTPGGRARFRALDPGPLPAAVDPPGIPADLRPAAFMVREAGTAGLSIDALAPRAGVFPARVGPLIERLESAGASVRAGEVLVAPETLVRLRTELLALVGNHHRSNPLSDGLPREEARERLFAHAPVAVFERVVQDLASAGTLVARDRLSLGGRHISLSAEEERIRAGIERAFDAAGLRPPDSAALSTDLGASPDVVEKLVQWLVRQRVLVRIESLLFHRSALQALRSDLAALKASGGADARIDVAAFKDRYGVTRKFAIPLLEYLDRERVTRRVGEGRVIL